MDDYNIHSDDDYADYVEPIEAYCVRCRESIEVVEPMAVWTRRGMPATRGECPICGGTVFRMGKTDMHRDNERPKAIHFGDSAKRKRPKLPRDTVYMNYATADEAMAQQIAADLERSGIAVWMHEHVNESDPVKWAGGVHPALKDCARMVFVLSPASLDEGKITAAWRFFREKRKPVVIAQIAESEPPDAIRRSPRFDFARGDYKAAFRQMMQELSR